VLWGLGVCRHRWNCSQSTAAQHCLIHLLSNRPATRIAPRWQQQSRVTRPSLHTRHVDLCAAPASSCSSWAGGDGQVVLCAAPAGSCRRAALCCLEGRRRSTCGKWQKEGRWCSRGARDSRARAAATHVAQLDQG
jgi:hypothetical protein